MTLSNPSITLSSLTTTPSAGSGENWGSCWGCLDFLSGRLFVGGPDVQCVLSDECVGCEVEGVYRSWFTLLFSCVLFPDPDFVCRLE